MFVSTKILFFIINSTETINIMLSLFIYQYEFLSSVTYNL